MSAPKKRPRNWELHPPPCETGPKREPSPSIGLLAVSGATISPVSAMPRARTPTLSRAPTTQMAILSKIMPMPKPKLQKKRKVPSASESAAASKKITSRAKKRKCSNSLQATKSTKTLPLGLNFKRKGLTRLLEHVQEGHIKHIATAHKDRFVG